MALSTRAIFAQVAALNRSIKRSGNPERMLHYLDLLDQSNLSRSTMQIATEELPSPFQQWCLFRARAYYYSKRYAECIDLCTMALEDDVQWINGGEGWLRCRIAVCKEKLGDPDALWDMYRLIQMPIELRWYVFHTLAEYVLDCDLPVRAFFYMSRGALTHYEHESLHAKWRLFWLGARICDHLNAPNLSALHSLLAVKLCIENRRPLERDLVERVDMLPVDPFASPSATELYGMLRPMWHTVYFGNSNSQVDNEEKA